MRPDSLIDVIGQTVIMCLLVFVPLMLIALVRSGWANRRRLWIGRVTFGLPIATLVLVVGLAAWKLLGPDRIDCFQPDKGMSQEAVIDALGMPDSYRPFR